MNTRANLLFSIFCGPLLIGGCAASGQVEHQFVAFDVAPDGKSIVFSAADADLYLLDLTKSSVVQLTKTERLETSPVFSPDGKTVAFSAGSGGKNGDHIFTLTLATRKVAQITTGSTTSDATPSYSKDGTQIVFARANRIRPYSMGGWTADQYDACIVGSKGGRVRRVTHGNYYQQARPQFLDNRNLIYGASGQYPDAATYLVKAYIPTGASKILTPKSGSDDNYLGSDPDVSPDGKRIVFISDRRENFNYDLQVMARDGSNVKALDATQVSRYNQNPVWMPDGKSILFLAGTSFNSGSRPIFGLWEIGAGGKNPRQIASSALFNTPLLWKKGA